MLAKINTDLPLFASGKLPGLPKEIKAIVFIFVLGFVLMFIIGVVMVIVSGSRDEGSPYVIMGFLGAVIIALFYKIREYGEVNRSFFRLYYDRIEWFPENKTVPLTDIKRIRLDAFGRRLAPSVICVIFEIGREKIEIAWPSLNPEDELCVLGRMLYTVGYTHEPSYPDYGPREYWGVYERKS